MQTIRTIMEWDIIFDNCWWMWIIFPAFLILALLLKRSDNRIHRRSGNVLLGLSVPGTIIALASCVMFIISSVWILIATRPGSKLGLGDSHIRFENSSIWVLAFSILILPIQGIASLITGTKILRSGYGKKIGIAAIILGTIFIAWTIFLARAYIMSVAD